MISSKLPRKMFYRIISAVLIPIFLLTNITYAEPIEVSARKASIAATEEIFKDTAKEFSREWVDLYSKLLVNKTAEKVKALGGKVSLGDAEKALAREIRAYSLPVSRMLAPISRPYVVACYRGNLPGTEELCLKVSRRFAAIQEGITVVPRQASLGPSIESGGLGTSRDGIQSEARSSSFAQRQSSSGMATEDKSASGITKGAVSPEYAARHDDVVGRIKAIMGMALTKGHRTELSGLLSKVARRGRMLSEQELNSAEIVLEFCERKESSERESKAGAVAVSVLNDIRGAARFATYEESELLRKFELRVGVKSTPGYIEYVMSVADAIKKRHADWASGNYSIESLPREARALVNFVALGNRHPRHTLVTEEKYLSFLIGAVDAGTGRLKIEIKDRFRPRYLRQWRCDPADVELAYRDIETLMAHQARASHPLWTRYLEKAEVIFTTTAVEKNWSAEKAGRLRIEVVSEIRKLWQDGYIVTAKWAEQKRPELYVRATRKRVFRYFGAARKAAGIQEVFPGGFAGAMPISEEDTANQMREILENGDSLDDLNHLVLWHKDAFYSALVLNNFNWIAAVRKYTGLNIQMPALPEPTSPSARRASSSGKADRLPAVSEVLKRAGEKGISYKILGETIQNAASFRELEDRFIELGLMDVTKDFFKSSLRRRIFVMLIQGLWRKVSDSTPPKFKILSGGPLDKLLTIEIDVPGQKYFVHGIAHGQTGLKGNIEVQARALADSLSSKGIPLYVEDEFKLPGGINIRSFGIIFANKDFLKSATKYILKLVLSFLWLMPAYLALSLLPVKFLKRLYGKDHLAVRAIKKEDTSMLIGIFRRGTLSVPLSFCSSYYINGKKDGSLIMRQGRSAIFASRLLNDKSKEVHFIGGLGHMDDIAFLLTNPGWVEYLSKMETPPPGIARSSASGDVLKRINTIALEHIDKVTWPVIAGILCNADIAQLKPKLDLEGKDIVIRIKHPSEGRSIEFRVRKKGIWQWSKYVLEIRFCEGEAYIIKVDYDVYGEGLVARNVEELKALAQKATTKLYDDSGMFNIVEWAILAGKKFGYRLPEDEVRWRENISELEKIDPVRGIAAILILQDEDIAKLKPSAISWYGDVIIGVAKTILFKLVRMPRIGLLPIGYYLEVEHQNAFGHPWPGIIDTGSDRYGFSEEDLLLHVMSALRILKSGGPITETNPATKVVIADASSPLPSLVKKADEEDSRNGELASALVMRALVAISDSGDSGEFQSALAALEYTMDENTAHSLPALYAAKNQISEWWNVKSKDELAAIWKPRVGIVLDSVERRIDKIRTEEKFAPSRYSSSGVDSGTMSSQPAVSLRAPAGGEAISRSRIASPLPSVAPRNDETMARPSASGQTAADIADDIKALMTEAAAMDLTSARPLELGDIAIVMKKGLPEFATGEKETVVAEAMKQGYGSDTGDGRRYPGMRKQIKSVFSKGDGLYEVEDETALISKVNEIRALSRRVIILDDGKLSTETLKASAKQWGKAGKDYCVISLDEIRKDLKENDIPLININAMAMMGVGILEGRVALFEIYYRIFTGEEASGDLIDRIKERSEDLWWIIRAVPRIVPRDIDAFKAGEEVRRIFASAA